MIKFDPDPDSLPPLQLKRRLECEQPSSSKKMREGSLERDAAAASRLVSQNRWENLKGGKVLCYQSKGSQSSSKVWSSFIESSLNN